MREKIRQILTEWYGTSSLHLVGTNSLCDLFGVSGCSFALWLQDNYSTNEKQGSDKPLPKGYWRKDFTDEIHKVEDLWVVFNNR